MATWKTIAEVMEEQAEQRGMLLQARRNFRVVWEWKFGPVPKTVNDHLNSITDAELVFQAMLLLLDLDHPDESLLDPTP